MDLIRTLVDRRIRELGLNRREVSRRIGMNDAYIGQFLDRGTPKSLPETVRGALAKVLKIQESDLVARRRRALGAAPDASSKVDELALPADNMQAAIVITEYLLEGSARDLSPAEKAKIVTELLSVIEGIRGS
jgi:hypothetical protein